MTNSSQNQRTLLWVSNNKDSGAGSLRDAVEKGNKLAAQGKAIEIAFTDNFNIKPMQRRFVHKKRYWLRTGPNNTGLWIDGEINYNKRDGVSDYHQYTINSGDWLINDRNTKNITIDGSDLIKDLNKSNPDWKEKDLRSIERVRSLIGIGNGPESINGVKPTRVDITRINLVNNEVKGEAYKGTGGSLAAGAAVLHWGGHLTWRDSVIQNNKVSGGIGKSGAKGGNGWYRHGYSNSSIVSTKKWPESATRGFDGSDSANINPGLNNLRAERLISSRGYGGGGGESEDAGNRYSKYGVVGRPGKSGANGRRMGQAGLGGGGGGGGGVSHQNQK